jgi:hypothetical protein
VTKLPLRRVTFAVLAYDAVGNRQRSAARAQAVPRGR